MIGAPASRIYVFDPQCIPSIPQALQTCPQWVVWQGSDRIQARTGKLIGLEKKPFDPKITPPRLAASDNAASWSTFQQCVDALPQCLALWQQRPRDAYRGGGIGFVFSKLSQGQGAVTPTDPYTGVALDHCRDPETGMIMPWAWHLITWLKSYAEVSPSGTGVKIFLQATLPGNGVNKHFLEIYDRGRFFTVTGWHVPGTPCTIEPRQAHIEALYTVHHLLDTGLQRYGERFGLLLAGHWEQVQRVSGIPTYRSHSEADLALCALLATVGATGEQIDTCIRLSGLYRPKWDEKHGTHTYGAMTIAKALRRCDGPPHTVSRRPDVPQQRQRALRQDNAAEAPLSWEPPVPFHDFALPAFPIAALPENLQHYVMALAQATQTPCDLAGTLVLAVCACALAKKVVVCIRPGYIEPVNLFMAVVLPPGNRKSTVFAAVMEPIQAFEAVETQRMEPCIAAAESQRRIAEKTLQQVEVRAAKAESTTERRQLMAEAEALARDLAALRVPARPRLITDDTTPERLATLLSLHGGRMAVMSPEGGEVFDHMRGRYTPNHLPNFGVYLKGHTGDTLRVDRVNRPAEYVQQPALTVALTMQPEVLHGLMDKSELCGRGLLGRFLYAMPASLLGRRRTDVPPVPETIRHAYSITITRLLTLSCDTDDPGQPVAHILQLAPTAGMRLQQFAAWLEPQLGPFGELGSMTDWAGKLVGAVAQLTGILHMVEHAGGAAPWEVAISQVSVEHAIALGEYFLQHARAAYAEMGTDPVMADAKYVLEWSSRAEIQHFTKREVFEGTKGRFKRVAALEPGLKLLMEHGFIRQRHAAARPGPGRKPSPTYDVNPFYSQNPPNSPNATHRSYSAHNANSTYSKVDE